MYLQFADYIWEAEKLHRNKWFGDCETIRLPLDYCVTQLKLYTVDKLSSPIFCCLYVCQASVTPDQVSTFSNKYRHTSPLLTLYHLTPSITNLYWQNTSQYHHILTQYHQVPLIIHHLVRHSSAKWIISLFTTHLMSHAQYTWSSLHLYLYLFVFPCIVLVVPGVNGWAATDTYFLVTGTMLILHPHPMVLP